jgi:peroxiredoxin
MNQLLKTDQMAVGDVVPTRELTTIRDSRITVPTPDALTHLQLRRYAGCPICNLHLRSVAKRHDEIVAAGIREVVISHSRAEDMRPHQGQLPFDAIADPERLLYREFGVETSIRAVIHPGAWLTPMNPKTYPIVAGGLWAGGSPAPRHGDSALGLPAEFLITPEGRVRAVKYGRHANDQWSVDELLTLTRG